MKTFLKYSSIALVVQVLLLIIVSIVQSEVPGDSIIAGYLMLYDPFISLIYRTGHYTGEAGIIEPLFKGVPLGVFVYSVFAGAAGLVIKRSFP
jgi:hypothetical protein